MRAPFHFHQVVQSCSIHNSPPCKSKTNISTPKTGKLRDKPCRQTISKTLRTLGYRHRLTTKRIFFSAKDAEKRKTVCEDLKSKPEQYYTEVDAHIDCHSEWVPKTIENRRRRAAEAHTKVWRRGCEAGHKDCVGQKSTLPFNYGKKVHGMTVVYKSGETDTIFYTVPKKSKFSQVQAKVCFEKLYAELRRRNPGKRRFRIIEDNCRTLKAIGLRPWKESRFDCVELPPYSPGRM